MRPRGSIPEGVALGGGGQQAPGSEVAVDAHARVHSRGFGLQKLDALQKTIQDELHNLIHHDAHYEPPTDRYGRAARVRAAGEDEQTEDDADPSSDPSAAAPNDAAAANVAAPSSSTLGFVNPAVVILTYKRRHYLLRTLDALVATPDIASYTLYVSQDAGGDVPDLSDLPAKYSSVDLHLLRHPRQALLTADQSATAYLAQHYKWLLDRLFLAEDGKKHSHVVIMEDDMLVAPDFLTLFKETAPLLDSDPTLMCVSSWNDNGRTGLVADPRRLMRTDYFPGLGWMTNARVWGELSPIFPLDQWDHFMRLDTTHRGRDCLIPEVSRNHNIGEEGTNMGNDFFARYLAPIALATEPVSFLRARDEWEGDYAQAPVPGLEHLRGAEYERLLTQRVQAAILLGRWGEPDVQMKLDQAVRSPAVLATNPRGLDADQHEWLILYDRPSYPTLAQTLNLIPFPRAVHRGISTVRLGGHLVYLADIKICPYIPDSHKFRRDPTMQVVVARQNEDCHTTCSEHQPASGGEGKSVCSQPHFQFINHCSVLKAHFACTLGCRGGVSGFDVPNYVDNPAKPELYGYCLTTEDESTCEAKHWSASRICPCIVTP